jgi:gluconate transporter
MVTSMDPGLYAIAVIGVSVALIVAFTLILRLPAFFALLIVAIGAGFALGAEPAAVIQAIRGGMGDTLGFVAVVIGLGAILGALLEASGGIERMARLMLERVSERRAPWVLALVGIIVGAPLFFEVAFVVVAPFLIGLAARSAKSISYFALPALMGMAMMHCLIPPHPGAVASTDILNADFGLVMLYGFVCGVPAVLISGPLYAMLFAKDLPADARPRPPVATAPEQASGIGQIGYGAALIGMMAPVVLILIGAFAPPAMPEGLAREAVAFVGHPFIALIVACLYAWVLLAAKRTPLPALLGVMGRALEPAGAITLVIGAGAVFKQVLVEAGVGGHLTTFVAAAGMTPIVFGFAVSALLRIAQGSATVAIVTSAGLTAPLVEAAAATAHQTALVVIAIGAGSIVMSHVNDAGFWLIKQYLGISEIETFKTWSIGVTIGGIIAFLIALGLSAIA